MNLEQKSTDQLKSENALLRKHVMRLTQLARAQQKRVSEITAKRSSVGTITAKINQFVLDHLSEAVLIINSKGKLVSVNQTACDVLGGERHEIVNQRISQFVELGDGHYFGEFFERVRLAKSQVFETKIITIDERSLPAEALLVFFDSDGIELACMLVRDLSHEKQVERAFQKSDKALRALLNAVPDLMFRLDDEGNYLDFKASRDDLLAVPSDRIIGSNVRDLLPEDQADTMLTAMRRAIDSSEVQVVEYELTTVADEEQQFEARIAPISSTEVLCIVRDITQRKLSEQVREDLIRKLEQKNAELERFTYTVSHDLKSPIITIKGFLELLSSDLADGELSVLNEHLDEISRAADKMKGLLDQLLELSRIGRATNRIVKVPFGELVRDALELCHGQVTQNHIDVVVHSNLPVVWGDRLQLVEVLQNLIGNAAKFMGDQPQPTIEIGSQCRAKRTLFFVRDNGIGIEPRFQERVFALFERFERTQPGTGVGLAIVQRIVEIHGGEVWVESEGLGKGSMFCFTIEQPKR